MIYIICIRKMLMDHSKYITIFKFNQKMALYFTFFIFIDEYYHIYISILLEIPDVYYCSPPFTPKYLILCFDFSSYLLYPITKIIIHYNWALSAGFGSPVCQNISAHTTVDLFTYLFGVLCKWSCQPKLVNRMDSKKKA